MSKRFTAFFWIFLGMTAAGAQTGVPNYDWYINPGSNCTGGGGPGYGTTYCISNADQLAGLSRLVNWRQPAPPQGWDWNNGDPPGWPPTPEGWPSASTVLPPISGLSNISVRLTGAINLNSYAVKGWEPIGTCANPFNGTFDGGGFTISGLTNVIPYEFDPNDHHGASSSYCNLGLSMDPAQSASGLFGYISGTIRDLGVTNVNITGGVNVGGVVGVIVGGGKVENCYTTGSVTGSESVGGVVGSGIGGGSVINSRSSATVSGQFRVGGVAGGDVSVTNSHFTGTVSGNAGSMGPGGSMGGVLGGNGNVTNSYSTGTVSGQYNIGGVAGIGNVTNSYSTGAVSGQSNVGGVAGSGNVTNSYSTGTVSGQSYVGGVLGGSQWGSSSVTNSAALNPEVKGSSGTNVGRIAGSADVSLSNNVAFTGIIDMYGGTNWWSKGANSLDGADFTTRDILFDSTFGGRFVSNWDGNINKGWTLEGGKLPGIGSAVDWPEHLGRETFSVSILPLMPGQTNEGPFRAEVVGNQAKTVTWTVSGHSSVLTSIGSSSGLLTFGADETAAVLTVTARSTANTALSASVMVIARNPSSGVYVNWDVDWYVNAFNYHYLPSGHFYHPSGDTLNFMINNERELRGLANIVNHGYNFAGKTITLSNDISTIWSGINWNNWLGQFDLNDSNNNWIPIGNSTNPFAGTFNGHGRTIRGIFINRPTADYQGLFGNIGIGGKVENVRLEYVHIRGNNLVGGIAGNVASGGSITNSYVSSIDTIRGNGSNVGGVVGHLAGNLTNSYSVGGVVTGASQVGGVAGFVSGGRVANSYSTVEVRGAAFAIGGIVGGSASSAVVTNCAALNPIVRGTANLGRVIGALQVGGTYTNNAAYTEMSFDDGLEFTLDETTKTLNGKDGADISVSAISASPTIGDRFVNDDGWFVSSGLLPGLLYNAVAFPAYFASTVSEVTVSPDDVISGRGMTQQFTAAVLGRNEPPQSVTWSILSGGVSPGTTISPSGLLTICRDEPIGSLLTVMAAPTLNPERFGTAVLLVEGVTSIAVSPKVTAVGEGAVKEFTAELTGYSLTDEDKGIIWSVEGNVLPHTVVDDDGVLAVASGETADTLRVIAVSVLNPAKSDTAKVAVKRVDGVSILQTGVALKRGDTYTFSAEVAGNALYEDAAVRWSVSGGVPGTSINEFTGVLSVSVNETSFLLKVTAVSAFDNTKTDIVEVIIKQVTSVTVHPADAVLNRGDLLVFTSDVDGYALNELGDHDVRWSLAGRNAVGTDLDQLSGQLRVAGNETSDTLWVTATSESDRLKSVTVPVIIKSVKTVAVLPHVNAAVRKGETLKLTASVNSVGLTSEEQAVTWSLTGNSLLATSIDESGLLTIAPNETADILTVKAESVFDNTKFAAVNVKILTNIIGADIMIIGTQIYGGIDIRPAPIVTFEGRMLSAGLDYTLEYADNIEATNQAKIILRGNDKDSKYYGDTTVNFTIAKKTPGLGDLSFTIPSSTVYTGEPQGIDPADITLNEGLTGLGAITLFYNNQAAAVNAGVYSILARIADGDNFTVADIPLGVYTISKAAGASAVRPEIDFSGDGSFTLVLPEASAAGQIFEYGINDINSAPTQWQDALTFTGMDIGTIYFVFARAKANVNYEAGSPSPSLSLEVLADGTIWTSTAEHSRVIPNQKVDKADDAVSYVNTLTSEFTAGPNPVSKSSSGVMNFFWHGKSIKSGMLTVYDASGNMISKIAVSDRGGAINGLRLNKHGRARTDDYDASSRRIVGSWDLRDLKGRPVSEGTYLVRGVITAVDGKKERVSLMIGIK